MIIYGDKLSGNCQKVIYTANYLGIDFEWVDIDILKGESRTKKFLSMNPAGQVPLAQFKDNHFLAQSNAILIHLAHGSNLIPTDNFEQAKMMEWLFWEQYSHETTIAVCRFHHKYLKKPVTELDQIKVSKGNAALDLMDNHLAKTDWFVGSHITLADIALVAYTRLAHEGGFDLTTRPNVLQWIARTEKALKIH